MSFSRASGVVAAGAAALFSFGVAGCGSRAARPKAAQGPPSWVDRGSGIFADRGGSAVFGLGIVARLQDPAAQARFAEERARNEIAWNLGRFVARVKAESAASEEFQANPAGSIAPPGALPGVGPAGRRPASVTAVSAAVGDEAAPVAPVGVQFPERWRDPSDGALYVLGKLGTDGLRRSLTACGEVDVEQVKYGVANAERILGELRLEGK